MELVLGPSGVVSCIEAVGGGPTKTRHVGSGTAGTTTPLPQRPSAANSYYNPLAVRVHPPVPTSGVLHDGIRLWVPAAGVPGFSIPVWWGYCMTQGS